MDGLGNVLRRIRREKGLTQAQVSGDRLTRNMLSQIENGLTNPSLPTLEYLAGRLEIPLSALFLSEEDRAILRREEQLSVLRALWEQGRDEECVSRFSSLAHPGTEACRLYQRSVNRLADTAFEQGDWAEAQRLYLSAAALSLRDGLGEEERQHAEARLQMIAQGRAGEITDPFPDGISRNPDRRLLRFVREMIGKGFAKSLAGLSEGLEFENDALRNLARAMICEAMGNDAEGRGFQMKIPDTSLDPFLRLYLYSMSEKCCVRMNDFASAYRYAKLRQELTLLLNRQ